MFVRHRAKSLDDSDVESMELAVRGKAKPGWVRFRWWNELTHSMFDEVPAQSIATFRLFWGLVMMLAMWGYIDGDYRQTYNQLVKADFMFRFPFFEWVPRLSLEQWKVFHWTMLVFAGMFAAGLCYRVAAPAFALGFALILFQDTTYYLNH